MTAQRRRRRTRKKDKRGGRRFIMTGRPGNQRRCWCGCFFFFEEFQGLCILKVGWLLHRITSSLSSLSSTLSLLLLAWVISRRGLGSWFIRQGRHCVLRLGKDDRYILSHLISSQLEWCGLLVGDGTCFLNSLILHQLNPYCPLISGRETSPLEQPSPETGTGIRRPKSKGTHCSTSRSK